MAKKIAFINSSKTWGGGEKWHLDSALALHTKGFDISIVCQDSSVLYKRAKKNKLKIITLNYNRLSFLNPFKKRKAKKILSSFDTAIMNLPSDLKLFTLSGDSSTKLIYRRGSDIPIRNNKVNRYALSKLDIIIANSEATKKSILKNGVLENDNKIIVIPNGIDIHHFAKPKNLENKIILGNLGRLVPQKNQIFFIELARSLQKREIDFEIIIGGKGRLEKDLRNEIKRENLNHKIKLIGEVKDLDSFYSEIDVFLLSSRWEGFGYVIAEAMSYKKPVITFNISSNSQLVKDNENGFLIRPFNTEEFAQKIIHLKENPDLISKFGESGYNLIKENFSFEHSLEKLIELI